MKKLLTLSLLLLFSIVLIGQDRPNGKGKARKINGSPNKSKGLSVSGKLINEKTKEAVEFANIIVYTADSSFSKGGVSGLNGEFMLSGLKPGKYKLSVSMIGYHLKTIEDIILNRDKRDVYLNKILMKPSNIQLDAVEIRASSAVVEYKLDKKIIRPENTLAAIGGTASDILKSSPSVEVDIEGNVSLRGSSDFHVLINGRPTVLTGSEALQQIPSNAVKNIEIITNPSVKYAPDGTSGIINIITKKNLLQGFSGQVTANGRSTGGYAGNMNLSYRTKKFNFFTSGGIFQQRANAYEDGYLNRRYKDAILTTLSDGETKDDRMRSNIEAGVEYNLNPNNSLTLSFKNRIYSPDRKGTIDKKRIFKDTVTPYSSYKNRDFFINSYSTSLSWFHKFNNNDDHNIQSVFFYRKFDNDIKNNTEYNDYDNDLGFEDMFIDETDRGDYYELKVDYERPISENSKLEAGIQSKVSLGNHNYNATKGDMLSDYIYDFDKNIHGIYASFSNSNSIVDIKLGLRAEYTDRIMDLKSMDTSYVYNNIDVYPSIHLSKQLPKDYQLQASYSRRVHRPRPMRLNPYPIFSDESTLWQGNPGLKPEFINSFELGVQKRMKRNFASFEAFYRSTENAFSRIFNNVDSVQVSTVINLDTRTTYGVEMTLNVEPFSWWSINGSASAYKYKITGNYDGKKSSQENNSWYTRVSSSFKVLENTYTELSGRYRGKKSGLMSERSPSYSIDLSVKQFLMNRKLTAVLAVRDVFNTSKRERTTIVDGLKSVFTYKRESPIFTLTLSYRFNNYKKTRTFNGSENSEGGYDE
ncbi:MAG: TonB-dependent receptor domain-containing protein [Hyphomicrobiales bacterium]